MLVNHNPAGNGKAKNKKKCREAKPDDICRHCTKTGHWISACPVCIEEEKKKGQEQANYSVLNLRNLEITLLVKCFLPAARQPQDSCYLTVL